MATVVVVGALSYLALHLFEPSLSLTWGYAHLNRYPGAWLTALAFAFSLPTIARYLDALPIARRPMPAPSWKLALGFALGAGALFLAIGWFVPTKPFSLDTSSFAIQVWKGETWTMRWYLLLATFTGLLRFAEWAWPAPVPARDLVPIVNAFLSGFSYALLAGSARRLGRDAFEVCVITLLAWTAFGNLQLALYYVDVYPFVQFVFALFLWTALRTLLDDVHPAWPIGIAMLAPFFYLGLLLLLPAAGLIVIVTLQRERAVRRLGAAFTAVVVGFGLATLPAYGRPFALGPLLADLSETPTARLGLSPDSSLLPIGYMLSAAHLWEWVHTFILIDGVGFLLCATTGIPLLLRFLRGDAITPPGLLILLLGPVLVYSFTMDPLWGPYWDWDLFSYAAVPTSVFGAYSLVRWFRDTRELRAALAGLLIAASVVHLAARLNTVEFDQARHTRESPPHVPLRAPGDAAPYWQDGTE